MDDLLKFRKMIAPIIIQVIFWIVAIFCIVSGIGLIFTGLFITGYGESYKSAQEVLSGIGLLFLGPIVIRLICEILVVNFRINETLTDIKNSIEHKGKDVI